MMEEETLSASSASSVGDGECNVETSMNRPVPLVGGHNKYEWIYLLLCVPNAVIIFSLSIGTISQAKCIGDYSLNQNPYLRAEVLACILAGISVIVALYGLFAEHQYDLYLHSVMIVFALFFSWFGFGMNQSCLEVFKIACNTVTTILSVICFALAWKATHVTDWVEFWIIGVSDALADMYKQVCYFLAVLRLDSAFIVIFAVYSITAVFPDSIYAEKWRWWLGYQFAMIVYAFLSWALGKFTVVKEDMFLYKSFQVLNVAYVIYLVAQEVLLVWCLSKGLAHDSRGVLLYASSIILGLFCIAVRSHMIHHMHKTTRTFGNDISSPSFTALVSWNSNNLLSHPRSYFTI